MDDKQWAKGAAVAVPPVQPKQIPQPLAASEPPASAPEQSPAPAPAANAAVERTTTPVTDGLRAKWKSVVCNTPVKLRVPIKVKVPRPRRRDQELVFDVVERTHGSFVLFNDATGAVRVSVKDMKMPHNPEEDCPWIDKHPADCEPDYEYTWPNQRVIAENQSPEGGLVEFGGHGDMMLPGGIAKSQPAMTLVGTVATGPVSMGARA